MRLLAMINIILFGPPGSGKGTQAVMLKEKYALLHISTGDIFRSEIGNKTVLGLEAKRYMDEGKLVPDEVTINMLVGFVDSNFRAGLHKGIIFDGFPRTIPQAEALDDIMAKRNTPVTKVLSLEVKDELLIQRIMQRGLTSGRVDDSTESTVRKRLEVYYNQTAPLQGYYTLQDKFISLNGEGSIQEVFELLSRQMDLTLA